VYLRRGKWTEERERERQREKEDGVRRVLGRGGIWAIGGGEERKGIDDVYVEDLCGVIAELECCNSGFWQVGRMEERKKGRWIARRRFSLWRRRLCLAALEALSRELDE
jgi:hypothetical protein